MWQLLKSLCAGLAAGHSKDRRAGSDARADQRLPEGAVQFLQPLLATVTSFHCNLLYAHSVAHGHTPGDTDVYTRTHMHAHLQKHLHVGSQCRLLEHVASFHIHLSSLQSLFLQRAHGLSQQLLIYLISYRLSSTADNPYSVPRAGESSCPYQGGGARG